MYGIRSVVLLLACGCLASANDAPPPNIILIVCDNLGYGDPGCFGSRLHRTPALDRLAKEGMKLTDFYSTSGVCTPSRASIMTGCYPQRVSMGVTDGVVLRPVSSWGLHPKEITVAEVLKKQGYATACIGKWHLGDQPPFLPTRQGFDYYLGIPYSDDMTPREGKPWPPLPLLENEKVIDAPVDRNLLTRRYTEASVRFLKENQKKPFFLYLAHAMPGSTRKPFASERFRGKSKNGAWGDSIEELDWSTGEILKALKELKLDRKTLLIWTSDNGAPRRNPPQGLNLPLKGWGYSTTEGGMRVPCLVRWPGMVPAGEVCRELTSTLDFLPTFAALAGTEPPKDRIIDGHNILPLLTGKKGATSPYEAFYYYHLDQLQAVRSGPWKLYLPLKKRRGARQPAPVPARLYNLVEDLTEKTDLSRTKRKVVERLLKLADMARENLGDVDRKGKQQRPKGRAAKPAPLKKE